MTVRIAPLAPKVYTALSTDTFPGAAAGGNTTLEQAAPPFNAALFATDTSVWYIWNGLSWQSPHPNVSPSE
jgi:hypothetical protein